MFWILHLVSTVLFDHSEPHRDPFFGKEKDISLIDALSDQLLRSYQRLLNLFGPSSSSSSSLPLIPRLDLSGNETAEGGSEGLRRFFPSNNTKNQLSYVQIKYTAASVFARLLPKIIDFFETRSQKAFGNGSQRIDTWASSCALFRLLVSTPQGAHKRGKWWIEYGQCLERLKRPNQAIHVYEWALKDPLLGSGERFSVQRRLKRLCVKPLRWNSPVFPEIRDCRHVTVEGHLLSSRRGHKNEFLGVDGLSVSVEGFALQVYRFGAKGIAENRWNGLHTEGGCIYTLFWLLMWDCIFAPIPHVFHHQFHSAPLDLHSPLFFETRQNIFEETFERLRSCHVQDLVLWLARVWNQNYGVRCQGIDWKRWDLQVISEIACCIGPIPLASLMSMIAREYKPSRRGLPDLVLWKADKSDDLQIVELSAKFVEVKGPRDKLSDYQRVWIDRLLSSGIDVEVCHVVQSSRPLSGLLSP